MRARVLLVEDTPSQAALALALLREAGHDARHAATGAEALAIAAEWQPDAALVDLGLPDMPGLDLLERLAGPVRIVVTAQGSISTAVAAMQRGAADFLVKPFPPERLRVTLANALEKRRLGAALEEAREALHPSRFHGFIGQSAPMQAVYQTIRAVAASRAAVFITGESGTGKEVAAEALHAAGPRARAPFVALNCAAIPAELMESEVFGHARGAFTGATEAREGRAAEADGGTLFLDEIGEMPLAMQAKLLRFVQTGVVAPVGGAAGRRVDVRLVAATNRDIHREVADGRFREDLFWRLYVVPVELPPLRAREGDAVLLARHFLQRFAREEGKRFRRLAPAAEAAILAHPWPGNVRQLQNAIRNAVALHDGEALEAAMLPAALMRPGAPPPAPAPAAAVAPAPPPSFLPPPVEPLAVLEKRAILRALEETDQDVAAAARLLEVNPSTIYRKLQAWRRGGT